MRRARRRARCRRLRARADRRPRPPARRPSSCASEPPALWIDAPVGDRERALEAGARELGDQAGESVSRIRSRARPPPPATPWRRADRSRNGYRPRPRCRAPAQQRRDAARGILRLARRQSSSSATPAASSATPSSTRASAASAHRGRSHRRRSSRRRPASARWRRSPDRAGPRHWRRPGRDGRCAA